MENKDLFSKEYVENLLKPFIGSKFRVLHNENKSPFIIENSMENDFQIDLKVSGISFYIENDYYLNRDLNYHLNKAFLEEGIYSHSLDDLSKRSKVSLSLDSVYSKILNYLKENIRVQLAFTHYAYIKEISVSSRGFIINGQEFIKIK